MQLNDQKLGDVFLALLKGESGLGKSIALASYASLGKMYIFDFEDRMRSVKNYYQRIGRQDIIDNIEFDTYYSFSKVRKKIEALQMNPKGIKSIGWDSLTSFTDRALSNTKDFKQDSQEKTGQNAGRTVGEFRVNTLDDFSAETSAVKEFVIEHALIFKSMKINFILTAHVIKVREEGEGKITHISRYLMTGGKKVAQIIPGYYDEAYHFNIEPGMSTSDAVKYTARTTHSGDDWAKTSLNLPTKIDFTNKVFYEEIAKYVPKQPTPDITKGELIVPSPVLTKDTFRAD